MNCLKKICKNQKICRLYTTIQELQNVIFRLDFDCDYFIETQTMPSKTQSKAELISNMDDRLKRLKAMEKFLNPHSNQEQPPKTYTCSKCGKTIESSQLANLDTEYNLDTDTQTEVALCLDCAKGQDDGN